MATSFKSFESGKDSVVTRNLLHEAIPITGTIVSSSTYADENIKEYSHGMFQSVYDYPYLSSSANHIFDITCGYAADSTLSQSSPAAAAQQQKKINIYNQMAQVLVGFDETGAVRQFDEDGDLTGGAKIKEAYFINFARLLTKDEIKKGSVNITLGTATSYAAPLASDITITDTSGSNGYKVNSPAGEYGILYATGADLATSPSKVGLVYYQAGIAVVTASAFGTLLSSHAEMDGAAQQVEDLFASSSINDAGDAIRHRTNNIAFNNTTELNSTVYFCRVNNTDFNYSANPTYLSESKITVKTNAQDLPVSYVTSVGLYSDDNELLAVAKLSEPLRKDPSSEFTIRCRLDY